MSGPLGVALIGLGMWGKHLAQVGAGEALAALAVILGALQSHQTGSPVNLSEL